MSSTDLTIPRQKPQPMLANDPSNLNFDMLDKIGEMLGGRRQERLPGILVRFKKGFWYAFVEKKKGGKTKTEAVKLRGEIEFVINVPQIQMGWRKWEEVQKKDGSTVRVPGLPAYSAYLLGDHDGFPAQDEVLAANGDDDESEWSLDKWGKPECPWEFVLIVPLRKPGETELHRLEVSSPSAKRSLGEFVQDWHGELGKHDATELPVVSLGTDEVEGKDGPFFVPTFDIVDWEEAIEEDNPEGGVGMIAADQAEDIDDDEEEDERPAPRKKAAPKKKAPTKRLTKKADVEEAEVEEAEVVDEDADDEDEAEEEEKPKARRSLARKSPARKKKAVPVDEDEDEEPEDDEDEAPVVKSRAARRKARRT